MYVKVFLLNVSLAYFIDQVDGTGALGAFPLLHYFRNCEIKNTVLIQCFRYLRSILTGILLDTYLDAT